MRAIISFVFGWTGHYGSRFGDGRRHDLARTFWTPVFFAPLVNESITPLARSLALSHFEAILTFPLPSSSSRRAKW